MRKNRNQVVKDIRPSMTTYYRPAQQGAPMQPVSSTAQMQQPAKKWSKRVTIALASSMLLLIVPLLCILYMDWRNFSGASKKLFGSSSVFDMFPTSQLRTTPDGMVHILIAGYSADDPGHGGANLTDTIMVLSISKKTHKGYMLSIPRDLYVQIPGNGSAKVNEVYQDGERDGFRESGYSEGGMGLLTQVVETVIGEKIDYNFLVNYAAVRDITNALDGVTMTVQSSDPRGIYDPGFKPEEGGALKLSNGANTIDGQTALKITRARGLPASSYGYPQADFNRTQYQQALLTGILDELTWKLVFNPLQNKKIFNAVAANTETNVKMDEVIPVYRLLSHSDVATLSTQTLRALSGQNYVTSYQTPAGQAALVPIAGRYDYSDVHNAVDSLIFSISR